MSTDLRITRFAGVCILLYSCLVAAQSQSSVTVAVGRRAVLNCDTRNINFPYDTSWERVDGTFLKRGVSYVIESVKMSDAGVYVCRIRNLNDNSRAATSRLQLNVVPASGSGGSGANINVKARASERLQMGGLLFRTCSVSNAGSSTWTYQWQYPDGRVVRSSILYVPNLQQVHVGTYRCTATSSTGRKLEQTFRFDPNGAPNPDSKQLTVKIRRVSIQKPFVLECYVEGRSGRYTYEWRKNDQLVTRGQRLTVSTLDSGTTGTYECVVTGQGDTSIKGRQSDEVQVVMKQSESKISLTPPPGPIHIVEANRNKELHCELDQTRDTVEVATWYFYPQGSGSIARNGERLASPAYDIIPTQSVSILVMKNLKPKNSGRYECRVMRDGKEVRREAYVLVVSDVGLEVYPSTLTYTIGKTKINPEFHCQVDNLPGGASNLRWTFKPSKPPNAPERSLPSNARRLRRGGVTSTSFLNVENPTLDNYGYYICRAPGGFEGRGLLIVRRPNLEPGIELVVRPGLIVTVNPGETARIICYERRRLIVPDWQVPGSVESQVTRRTESGNSRILIFRDVRADQDGTRVTCSQNGNGAQVVTIRVNPGCPAGQRRCRSGTCIISSLFCNGRPDCPDGSDESPTACSKCEPNEVQCQSYAGRAPAKSCVPVHWICDGENDCGNGWDERNCVVGVGCDKTLFQCSDGVRFPRGFQCDGESDCARNDDETSCSTPRVVIPSGGTAQRRSVRQGQELRLQCEAIGIGAPKIVWRYNWGFVTANNRIDQRCIDPNRHVSTLIISNAQPQDAGIYTCEALNNQGRAFGEDYIVDVTRFDRGRVPPPPPPPPPFRPFRPFRP